MDDTLLIVVITVVAVIALRLTFFFLLCGGDGKRMKLAIRASWRTMRDNDFAAQVEPMLAPPPPKDETPPKPDGRPLRMLAVLQREGRLVDFLLEDIGAYPDAQIGAAVRDIHGKCKVALNEHLVLEPVFAEPEGATVKVAAGFDPSAIRLTGNVTGEPPFQGTLLHHGWRVKEIKLAPPPEGHDELVLMPAEVELP